MSSTPNETCKTKSTTIAPTATTSPDDKRCAYPSKTCMNPRAVKQNKTMHRLCEFHRRKANLNQLRMQQRRRLQRHQSINSGGVASSLATADSAHLAALEVELGGHLAPSHDREFSPEELKLLEMMLFDSDESEVDFEPDFRRSTPRFSC